MNNKTELNKDERSDAIVDIAEGFKQCDTYSKGYIAGFIEAARSMKGSKDINASLPSTQLGL